MKRFLFAGLCALAAGLGGAGSADAQCLKGPGGCGMICMHLFPMSFQHGPLYNYGDGTGSGGYGCGANGCGKGGCGHDGLFGHWGPWNRSAGCNSCGGGSGHGGWFGSNRNRGCDSCDSGGRYARATYGNVFARLHPTAHKCGQTCGINCGSTSACGNTSACNTCGGRGGLGGCGSCGGHLRGLLGNRGSDACGGHGLGGLFGNRGCDSCGGHGGLFGHHGGGCCGAGGGLQTAPWYLYWPTADNRFQVPAHNAAGWRGNHFVLPAPSGPYAQVGGANPYFPAR